MTNIEAIDRSEIILLKELNHRVTALEAKARRVTKGINVGKLGLGAVGFRRFSFVREATTTPDVDKKDAFADNNMNLPLLLFTATVLGVTGRRYFDCIQNRIFSRLRFYVKSKKVLEFQKLIFLPFQILLILILGTFYNI